jgi:hypothetical protein
MSQPACGPFTDGHVSGSVESPLVPEGLVRYRGENCLGPRPNRESAREEIADYVMAMLGAPVVRLEIDKQQLSIAVDQAIKTYERGAPRYEYQWFYFHTVPGENRYKMPCDIGFIRDVRFRSGSLCPGGGIDDSMTLSSSIPFTGSLIAGGSMIGSYGLTGSQTISHVNVGEWHLFQAYEELFQRVSSREPTWEMAGENTIILYPMPVRALGVAVEYVQRKKDWEDVADWIKKYALALAKEMLGRIRSKYDRYVSPSGGVTMDGAALLQESREDVAKLSEELLSLGNDHLLPYVG